MERTKPEIIDAPFLEFYKAADDIDDVDTALDLLYGLLRDQLIIRAGAGTGKDMKHRGFYLQISPFG